MTDVLSRATVPPVIEWATSHTGGKTEEHREKLYRRQEALRGLAMSSRCRRIRIPWEQVNQVQCQRIGYGKNVEDQKTPLPVSGVLKIQYCMGHPSQKRAI
jgi:hypothetical protein